MTQTPLARRLAVAMLTLALAAGSAAVAAPAGAAVTRFTAGDVVVYRVGSGTAALGSGGTAVFLDEYSPSATLVQSVPMPTAPSGANRSLVASGTAGSEGLLTLSADSRYLVATGYASSVGTSGLSSSAAASVPRTVARVDASDSVDTTTALTDFADGNNPRSATSSDGQHFWVGGAAGGVRYAELGATTSTAVTSSTYKNVREVQDVDGQLYTSADPTKASLTVATVGSGLPTSGTPTPANLALSNPPTQPYGYSLLTLGTGTAPDTLYVADNANSVVDKYSLSGGSWTLTGSVSVPLPPDGLTANDVNGVVTVYVTGVNATTNAATLYSITDSSGAGGTLSGTPSTVATSAANESFRGVAFAPGTVIGSGGPTAPPANPAPTITAARTGLPSALGDDTDPGTAVTVADSAYDPSQLTVTATSSDQAVAADSGITVTGSGATRTLAVTPAGTSGKATITLTVTAPDGQTGTTNVTLGVSPDIGQPSARYYSGAGNASAAVSVGGGYAVLGDDESNVLRLYDLGTSGPPVATFDFTSQLPFGSTEIDIEAAARSGNTIYWEGSMSNTSSGNLAPARSTVFATTVSGTGANTTLTYAGAYTGLRGDLIAWDRGNGNALGLADSAAAGVGGHDAAGLNLEGMEFAGSSNTLYLSFRSPLEPTTDRHLALLVPLTDVAADIAAGPTATGTSTFGTPVELDLGGLGVRDIKENADGQYLISAGTADDTNTGFVLYYWDGNPDDDPQQTGTTLPQLPSSNNAGSWETIVGVPDPLTSGSSLELIQDDGSVDWYGDGLTTKTGEPSDLQKSVGITFGYSPPGARASATSLSAGSTSSTAGQPVTYTATVTPATGNGTPSGTVEFEDGGSDIPGCAAQPLAAGAATCTVASYTSVGNRSITATYNGDDTYQGSTSTTLTHGVTPAALDHLTVSPSAPTDVAGAARSFTAEGYDAYGNDLGDVTAATTFTIAPSGSGAVAAGASCSTGSCSATHVGTYAITATDGTASGTAAVTVIAGPVATLALSPANASVSAGTAVTFTATGLDSYGNPTGDETAAAAFGIVPVTGSSSGAGCSGASCVATAAGAYVVDASVPTTTGTASGSTGLTVTAGPLAVLTLSPANAAVQTGQSQTYTATGADSHGNTLGDLTASTTFAIGGGGSCSGNACTAIGVGTHTVTGTDGTVTGTATLTATAVPVPRPAVSAVSPAAGPTTGSSTVTITGTGFAGATGVVFGTSPGIDVTVVSDTQLTVVTPAHAAGVVDVEVSGPGGTSRDNSADTFEFTAPPGPVVTSLSPTHGPVTGGTTVTVTGRHLTGATAVSFGATSTTNVTVVSPTQLSVTAPAHAAGAVGVEVTTPGGTSAPSGGDRYTFDAVAPAVSALAPRTGTTRGRTTVTITGTGLSHVRQVRFGSTAARSFTVVSDTRITAVSPVHEAGTVAVTITTPAGTSRSVAADRFTYVVPAPQVTAIAPRSGPVRGGTKVTISGTGLSATTRVTFGSRAASSLDVVSDTKIVVVSPKGSRGRVAVTVRSPGGRTTRPTPTPDRATPARHDGCHASAARTSDS